MTFCPDCEKPIPDDLFVAHRADMHPPRPMAISGAGAIRSQTRFGTDLPADHPDDEE